ncbi:unnamed protein product [Strongylus vulgaris]|uniref:Uncharacterized protein n=1 Tax=Strongylus vulgaris TaxID=40348 RepID=A0A3P7J128_STRVU|nr:unnamed protein product [Strongylus vulgaris]
MPELTEERVVQYLRDNPSVLENYVTGPNVSSETFQKWIQRRNNWNHLRRDAKKIFNGAWGVSIHASLSMIVETSWHVTQSRCYLYHME